MPSWIKQAAKHLRSLFTWWELMSGGLSIPFALLALFLPSSARVLFAVLAFVSVWVLVVSQTVKLHSLRTQEGVRRELLSFLLELENRIAKLRRMQPLDVIMCEKSPTFSAEDQTYVNDAIFKYLAKNVSLSTAGVFLASTGLEPEHVHKTSFARHVQFLSNRAIRLERIIAEYKT